MLYHSTRSVSHTVDSAQAVLEGLAPDGGLYMPENFPAFDWQDCLRGSSTEMSAKILAALLPDIPDMDTLVRRAYAGKFETEDLTPTVSVGGFSVGDTMPPRWGEKHPARRRSGQGAPGRCGQQHRRRGDHRRPDEGGDPHHAAHAT